MVLNVKVTHYVKVLRPLPEDAVGIPCRPWAQPACPLACCPSAEAPAGDQRALALLAGAAGMALSPAAVASLSPTEDDRPLVCRQLCSGQAARAARLAPAAAPAGLSELCAPRWGEECELHSRS